MNETPYDPSGKVQQTSHAGYAQLKGKGASSSLSGSADDASITKVGIMGMLYGLVHAGICTFFLFGTAVLAAMASAPQVAEGDGQAQVSASADQALNLVGGFMLIIGIIGMTYGVGCIVGSIGVFMRKNWGRIIVLIYGGFAGVQGALGLLGLVRNIYLMVLALEVVPFSELIELIWLPMTIGAGVTLFCIAFSISAFKVLLGYGSSFD